MISSFRLLAVVGTTTLFLSVACGRSGGEAGAEPAPDVADAPGTPASPIRRSEAVRTTLVRSDAIDALLTASGSIAAPRATDLSPEVSGRLAEVRVDIGDDVERGDVVFLIDPEPYRIQLAEAHAGVELARAEAAQERAEVDRTLRLADQEIMAQRELEQRRTRLAVAEARVSQAEARVSRFKRELDRTTVRAPYAGSVVARHLHEGAMVAPGAVSVVVTLQESTGFEAIIDVPEAAPVPVEVGDDVELLVEGIPAPIPSKIERVNARVDAESRTYEVRAVVGREWSVKSGSFVRAEITPAARRTALVVDRPAVRTRDGRSIAFRYEDGIARETEIRLGAAGRELVEVLAGLDPGAEVIVGEVVDRLADGTPVSRDGPAPTLSAEASARQADEEAPGGDEVVPGGEGSVSDPASSAAPSVAPAAAANNATGPSGSGDGPAASRPSVPTTGADASVSVPVSVPDSDPVPDPDPVSVPATTPATTPAGTPTPAVEEPPSTPPVQPPSREADGRRSPDADGSLRIRSIVWWQAPGEDDTTFVRVLGSEPLRESRVRVSTRDSEPRYVVRLLEVSAPYDEDEIVVETREVEKLEIEHLSERRELVIRVATGGDGERISTKIEGGDLQLRLQSTSPGDEGEQTP